MFLSTIKLDGLSGASISVENNEIVKRCHESYSPRLLKQAELQNNFSNRTDLPPGINAVKIKRIPNNTTIIMDLIRTPNLHSILPMVGPSNVKDIATYLRSLIRYEKEHLIHDNDYQIKIVNKIRAVEDTFVRSKLQNLFQRIQPIKTTLSHGDLTLSNILYYNNQLHLIDFLDGFISSYILDICKLRQDLLYMYSDKYEISYHRTLYYRYILDEIMKECDVDNDTLRFFDVLNLARILPYTEHKTRIIERITEI